MFALIDRDRERLSKTMPWPSSTRTEADSLDYIRATMANREAGIGFDYGIHVRESGSYAGNIGAHNVDVLNRRCELGYWIGGEFEGGCLVTEGVRLLTTELFRVGFHRLEICCAPDNPRSAAVALRSGFTLEGVLRDDTVLNGKLRSTMLFSRLSTDPSN